MKKFWIIVVLLLVGCSEEIHPDFDQLTRIEFLYDTQQVQMLEDIEMVKTIFEQVEWEQGIPLLARSEDVVSTLYIMNEETKVEALYTYRIWFEDDGSSMFIDEDNDLIGKLDDLSTTKLKRAFSCEFGCIPAP